MPFVIVVWENIDDSYNQKREVCSIIHNEKQNKSKYSQDSKERRHWLVIREKNQDLHKSIFYDGCIQTAIVSVCLGWNFKIPQMEPLTHNRG